MKIIYPNLIIRNPQNNTLINTYIPNAIDINNINSIENGNGKNIIKNNLSNTPNLRKDTNTHWLWNVGRNTK